MTDAVTELLRIKTGSKAAKDAFPRPPHEAKAPGRRLGSHPGQAHELSALGRCAVRTHPDMHPSVAATLPALAARLCPLVGRLRAGSQ